MKKWKEISWLLWLVKKTLKRHFRFSLISLRFCIWLIKLCWCLYSLIFLKSSRWESSKNNKIKSKSFSPPILQRRLSQSQEFVTLLILALLRLEVIKTQLELILSKWNQSPKTHLSKEQDELAEKPRANASDSTQNRPWTHFRITLYQKYSDAISVESF